MARIREDKIVFLVAKKRLGEGYTLSYSSEGWLSKHPGNAFWSAWVTKERCPEIEDIKVGDRLLVTDDHHKVLYVKKLPPVIQVENLSAVIALGKTVLDAYKKFFIGHMYQNIIAIVPSDDHIYDPLVGLTTVEATNYVKEHSEEFDKAHPCIRQGILDFLVRYEAGEL